MNDANGLYYMRTRYYNPEIKRFINQDVVNGVITNSQSLNKYCYVQGNPVSLIDPFGLSPLGSFSSIGHTVLDVIGFIPGIGDIADGINAVWYMAEGNWAMAAASAISLLPFGDILAKSGKFLVRGGKKIAKVMSNVAGASVDIFAHATSFASRGAKLFGKFGDVVAGGLMLGGAAIKKGADFIGSKISKGVDFVSSKISKSVDADDVARVTKNADVKTSENSASSTVKVHGNSKKSTKLQHGYEIYDTDTNDVVKTGISGQSLNKNGTSPRANRQVNALNKAEGYKKYDARVVKTNMEDRATALEWERQNALRLWEEGNSMSIHSRPRPWSDK